MSRSFAVLEILLAFQLWLIGQLTLFLTPEFSVYPYFVVHGLKPYLDIIDQHFPVLFYGPFNLTGFDLYLPSNLVFVFLGISALANLAFWQLVKPKVKTLLELGAVQLGFILALGLLAVNHLWLESFAMLFTLAALWLLQIPRSWGKLFAGALLCLAVFTRVTLAPLLLLLWLPYRRSRSLLLGAAVVVAWIFIWLWQNHLLIPFREMLLFNRQYAAEAAQLPSRSDLIRLSWVIIWVWLLLKPKLSVVLATFAALIPTFPRFELFHGLLLASLPAGLNLKKLHVSPAYLLWLLPGLFLVIRQTGRELDINFFYPDQLYQQAQAIKHYDADRIYFFGGPDQLYLLTNSLPPDNFYLPSLPWYHHRPDWISRQLAALDNHPQALVVVNRDSRIGDQNLLDYSQLLYQFIRSKYQLVETIDQLEIWTRQPTLATRLYENRH